MKTGHQTFWQAPSPDVLVTRRPLFGTPGSSRRIAATYPALLFSARIPSVPPAIVPPVHRSAWVPCSRLPSTQNPWITLIRFSSSYSRLSFSLPYLLLPPLTLFIELRGCQFVPVVRSTTDRGEHILRDGMPVNLTTPIDSFPALLHISYQFKE